MSYALRLQSRLRKLMALFIKSHYRERNVDFGEMKYSLDAVQAEVKADSDSINYQIAPSIKKNNL